jgi:hypothetical protein
MTARLARQCGSCQLCCKLLPVRSLDKGAGERCRHQQHHKGCKVYAKLFAIAPECRLWNCRWLVDDAGDVSRPDRTHYVIDVMPDFIRAEDADGQIAEVPVVQIWVDPDYPDAHRDPALREWLDRERHVALIRYSSGDGFCLFPPSRMANREWMEKRSINDREEAHTFAEVARVLAAP